MYRFGKSKYAVTATAESRIITNSEIVMPRFNSTPLDSSYPSIGGMAANQYVGNAGDAISAAPWAACSPAGTAPIASPRDTTAIKPVGTQDFIL
jgi:hypothetical protein